MLLLFFEDQMCCSYYKNMKPLISIIGGLSLMCQNILKQIQVLCSETSHTSNMYAFCENKLRGILHVGEVKFTPG